MSKATQDAIDKREAAKRPKPKTAAPKAEPKTEPKADGDNA